jgi:FtsP/CotA-like multicopper oxidase with cupredoxin domain
MGSEAVFHGIAPEFDKSHPVHHPDWDRKPLHTMRLEYTATTHQWVPGVFTPALGYNGTVPGPMIRARLGEPMVVRVTNLLDLETSLHLHGAHSPSHADGHPCFYTMPHKTRDYYYPNCVPRNADGTEDWHESPSTMWYHDHGNDVTAHNVVHGLMGFCLFTDPFEEKLMTDNVLPMVDGPDGEQGAYDVPLALTDQRLNADGTIFWDPLDHDGRLGELYCINGVVQPFLEVERRKYRFRILDASLARIYELRLSNNQAMLQIGNDSWLLPKGVTVKRVTLAPGKRADVIIDFSKLANNTVLYLENIMEQVDGRKPKKINTKEPTQLLKFIVRGDAPVADDVTIDATTPLRPHHPIPAAELVENRRFDLGRSNGAWVINGDFYSATRADANPGVNLAERWTLNNGSGGWVHPVHLHLESHQILTENGRRPREVWAYKSDTAHLDVNTEMVIAMRFRTFQGPFVFHCHNNNHEDMRMMKQWENCPVDPVTGVKAPTQLNGKWFSVDPAIAGIPEDVILANPILFS